MKIDPKLLKSFADNFERREEEKRANPPKFVRVPLVTFLEALGERVNIVVVDGRLDLAEAVAEAVKSVSNQYVIYCRVA